MNYWLVCLPRDDMLHCMKVGTFGLGRKHIIGSVAVGDAIVCCAGKGDWKIIALGHAISDYYVDLSAVFLKDGVFPDRFDFESVKLKPEFELDLMAIIDKLGFVTNIVYWAVYFRNGIVKLSEQDWELINKSLSELSSEQ